MIRIVTLILCFVLVTFKGYSQTEDRLNSGSEPIGGISKLALEYYKIGFTKEQREKLQDVEIEFIYSIDKDGIPTLEKIHGVDDEAILDSLESITHKLPRFHPQTVDGVKVNSIYTLQLQFPKYRITQQYVGFQDMIRYQEAKYEDFEYIHKSGERVDVMFGGVGNSFLGKPSQYLAFGGGMKVDVLYTGEKGMGGGLMMSFYGNKLKQNYPISSTREQNAAPPTLLLGVTGNKLMMQKERSEFNLQLEIAYAIQNITPRLDVYDKDWVQLNGFSPGIVGNYLLKLGKDKTSYYYGRPTLLNHYLNMHGAVRPVFFGLKEASGIMLEFGLSYRLVSHYVDEYKLKPGF